MKIHVIMMCAVFLMLIAIVQAAPPVNPTTQVSTQSTLEIESPPFYTINQGNEHRFHAHVINVTKSKTNATTQCAIHVYNSTGWDIDIGSQWMEFETYNGIDFAKSVSGGNFTNLGDYSFVIQCNSSNEVGFFVRSFEVVSPVTGSGYGLFILLIGFALGLLILAIAMKNEYLGFISGAIFILVGLFVIAYGINGLHNMYVNAIGWVSLGLGIIFFISAAFAAAEGSGLFHKGDNLDIYND